MSLTLFAAEEQASQKDRLMRITRSTLPPPSASLTHQAMAKIARAEARQAGHQLHTAGMLGRASQPGLHGIKGTSAAQMAPPPSPLQL